MSQKKVSVPPAIKSAVKKILELDRRGKVQFILLYGSLARGEYSKLSDVDLVIGYAGDKRERFNFRVRVLGELGDRFDVQIFQDLPLYVRVEALKGKVMYAKNMRSLNNVALETIKDFQFFEPRFLDYISR